MIRFATLLMIVALATPALCAQTTRRSPVERVITKIDTKPTLITAKLKGQSAADIFFKLSEPAGGGISPRNETLWDDPNLAATSFSAEWDRTPFWSAMIEACDSTGLRAAIDTNRDTSGQLVLEQSKSQSPSSVDGIALVRVSRLLRDTTIAYADGSKTPEQVAVTMQVLLEPRLQGLAWVGPITIDQAEDEAGHALESQNEKPRDEVGFAYGSTVTAVLRYPKTVGQQIATLRGTIHVQYASEVESVRLPLPLPAAKEIKVNVGSNKLTFKTVQPNPDGSWNVSLVFDRGKKESLAHWRIAVRRFAAWQQSLSLASEKGAFRGNGGSSGWDDNHAEMNQSYSPVNPGDLASELRVALPIRFAETDVKFEFKDLPMP